MKVMGFILLLPSVYAEHACEIVFKKFRAGEATREQLGSCYQRLGKPKSVEEAERYLSRMEEYERRLAQKEREIREGMRSGSGGIVVKKFDFGEIGRQNEKNLALPVALSSKATFHSRREDSSVEMNPDQACRELGFEKSIEPPKTESLYEYSKLADRRKENPGARFVAFRCQTGLASHRLVVIDMKNHSGNTCPRVNLDESDVSFEVYTELTCQRNKRPGESAENFVIDPNLIRSAAAEALAGARPRLSIDAARLLDVSRSTARDNAVQAVEPASAGEAGQKQFFDFGGFRKKGRSK